MYSRIALSIGGSDSGGGAGIQADLRTFMALKVHGCSVITCITAQNSIAVNCVEAVENNTLLSQLDTLFSDFDIDALKTGMLFNERIINDAALKLNTYKISKIIDPVMVTRTGSKLLEDSAINAYKKLLLPIADLVTPNIFESNLLTGLEIKSKEDIENAAINIIGMGAKAVLIKGGGLKDMKGKDFFLDLDGRKEWLVNNVINTKNTHGSGCTLSAAICGYKALGFELLDSIRQAKLFVEKSLENSYKIGSGPGPLGHH
ncbi:MULTISPECIES: bifunctional hydroxymethylpyrimidine kinase/phosphomethylpyrimidine kinase [Prochlorococcus]|uniref:Phosphomethylpyrimidine kinase n=1 Tax=Prochlorococcus marinus str. MIT 9116 TaxID=167544 RepID=A0A0A1ZRS5_PROMR|nr:bifunctional hydroxymethylpyrimidine kinase/phosphomethylpyrimidine kinase [Prochlorococcus marinus]KGF90211.1 Phosphomethylpyrimidine kinase [Prochlorococcus marinus str. MIT 9107]KGF91236.1 Phosphomethylpyrimidine kinase [Prochlorococcus marinus str. MIT 9116]KGF94850.1 Phosphomethylpyrimidine kinase [Prochlorococcus marinus str. MIT 9123]